MQAASRQKAPTFEVKRMPSAGLEEHLPASTEENMDAAVAHWRSGAPPKAIRRTTLGSDMNSDATSSIGQVTPGGVTPGAVTPGDTPPGTIKPGAPLGAGTPKKFDSASKLANSLAFDSHSSPANPSLQIVSTGARWESVVGYSRAVKRGPFVFVSGTASVDQGTGQVMYPEDAYKQTKQALAIIDKALQALGASMTDVVRTRMFVSDLCADSAAVSKAHGEVFCSLRPASTMVQAARMYNQVLVMIEVDAIVGSQF